MTSELAAVSDDYSGVDAWEFSFDVKYDTGNFIDTWLRFRFQDASSDGWHLDVADAFPDSWHAKSVTFDPSWTDVEAAANGWQDETGGAISWQQLMSDVYHPEIRFLLGDQESAIAHVDNINLSAVPEPSPVTLAMIALAAVGFLARRRDA